MSILHRYRIQSSLPWRRIIIKIIMEKTSSTLKISYNSEVGNNNFFVAQNNMSFKKSDDGNHEERLENNVDKDSEFKPARHASPSKFHKTKLMQTSSNCYGEKREFYNYSKRHVNTRSLLPRSNTNVKEIGDGSLEFDEYRWCSPKHKDTKRDMERDEYSGLWVPQSVDIRTEILNIYKEYQKLPTQIQNVLPFSDYVDFHLEQQNKTDVAKRKYLDLVQDLLAKD